MAKYFISAFMCVFFSLPAVEGDRDLKIEIHLKCVNTPEFERLIEYFSNKSGNLVPFEEFQADMKESMNVLFNYIQLRQIHEARSSVTLDDKRIFPVQ
ncbi:MAG: hypothetical protein MRY21_03315 [Simkaniaceae bacterium]|nr:hypothetical protein [Simkaniaceae bacterium]